MAMRLLTLILFLIITKHGFSQQDTIWETIPKDTVWLTDPNVDTTKFLVEKVVLVSQSIKAEISALLKLRPICVDYVDFKVELVVVFFNESAENNVANIVYIQFTARETIFNLGVSSFFVIEQDTIFVRVNGFENIPDDLFLQDSSQGEYTFNVHTEFEYYYSTKPGSLDDYDMDVIYVSELDLLPRMHSFPWVIMKYDLTDGVFKLDRKQGCPEIEPESESEK